MPDRLPVMDAVAIEVAHWSAGVPLALLLVLGARGRAFGAPGWLVAVAFATSFIADSLRSITGIPFVAQPYYLPLQFALFALAVSVGRPWLGDAIATLAVVGAAASALLPMGPDVWVRVVGSIIVLALAKDTSLAWPMFAYCGLGTAFYLWMLTHGADVDAARPWWYAYQASRLTAFGLFGRAAWRRDA